jgi:hypothetical protein
MVTDLPPYINDSWGSTIGRGGGDGIEKQGIFFLSKSLLVSFLVMILVISFELFKLIMMKCTFAAPVAMSGVHKNKWT